MSLSLQPSLRQTVSISPQIQQSLQLLQTPALELQNLLQTELQTNPVLEEELRPTEASDPSPEEEDDSSVDIRDSDWPISSSRADRPEVGNRHDPVEPFRTGC